MTSEIPVTDVPETEETEVLEAEAPESTDAENEAGDANYVEDDAADFDNLRLVEALLFASSEPLAPAQLARFLPDDCNLDRLLADLETLYANRGVNLVKRGGRWAFRTAEDLAPRMELEQKVTRKLSRVALETLAVIAYHQPVTRAEIEEIRGVALSKGTLDALLEIGWIRPKGRRRTPGRPVTWGTSESFLDHFGLESVDALPGVEELKAAGLLDARPALTALSDRGLLPAAGEVQQERVEGEDDEDDGDGDGDASEQELLEAAFGEDLLPQEVDLSAGEETDGESEPAENLGEPEGLQESEGTDEGVMFGGTGDEAELAPEEDFEEEDDGDDDLDLAASNEDDADDDLDDDDLRHRRRRSAG